VYVCSVGRTCAHVSSSWNVPGILWILLSQMFSIADDELSNFSELPVSLSFLSGVDDVPDSASVVSESVVGPMLSLAGSPSSASSPQRRGSVLSRSRAFVFTLNNYLPSDVARLETLVEEGVCRYLVFGRENAPSTGTPHLQGFIYFGNAKSSSAVCKLVGKAHVEVSKDDPSKGYASAIDYCRKGGNFLEFGVPPKSLKEKGQASKDAWDSMLASAKKGVLDEIPSVFLVRYYNTFKAIRKDFMVKPADSPCVTGVWVQGPAGIGKSRFVRNLVGSNFYRKMRNHWWDGYQSEPYVVCDDVDKFDVKLGGLVKDWCDRYSFTAEAKGGAMSIRPTLVFITSQYSISEIWQDKETCDALTRRCVIINFFDPQFVFPVACSEILSLLNDRNINS